MAGLYSIGQAYLNNQYPINNGGITGFILNSLKVINGTLSTSNIQNSGVWFSYVQQFLFNTSRFVPIVENSTYQFDNLATVSNPNRGYTIMMIFWLSTFLILFGALIIVSIFQLLEDKKDRKEIENIKILPSRKPPSLFRQKRTKRFIVLFSMGLIFLLWIIFISMLCASQYILSSKFTNNSSSNNGSSSQQYSSVTDAVSLSFQYLNNFFNVLSSQTSIFLNSSLSNITTNLQSQLTISITGFGNQVLIAFNVTNVFNTAQQLLTSLNQVVNSMTYINSYCQNILGDIDNTKGAVSVYQSSIDIYLNHICNALNNAPSLQTICQALKTKNTLFKTGIKTSSVSSSSSVIMLFVLQQYNINISSITSSFYVVDTAFKNKLNLVYNSTVSQFNIGSYLTVLSTTWASLLGSITPIMSSAQSYNTYAGSVLSSVSKYENLVIIILIFLIFIMILVVLFFSFRDSVQDKSINRYLNFFIQFIFIFILLLSASVSIAILISSNFSKSEICNQVNTTDGINVLDQMLNAKLSIPWNTMIASVLSSSQGIPLTIAQPTNILSGIKDRCRNTSMGLLSVLGMSNFVNVTQIIRSQSVLDIVINAKNDSLNAFLAVNPQQIMPTDITAFVSQTATVISYFDTIDYNGAIVELQKPLVGIADFQGYFNDLSIFALNASQILGWNSDLQYLNNTLTQLLKIAPNWSVSQQNISTLTQNFQNLQTYRKNSLLMNELLATIANVQNLFTNRTQLTSIFSDIYNQLIAINLLNTVEQQITSGLSMITFQVIPCMDLSLIFEAFTTTFCSSSNLNVTLATFGILLLIQTVFCQIVSIIIIASILLRLNAEKNESKC